LLDIPQFVEMSSKMFHTLIIINFHQDCLVLMMGMPRYMAFATSSCRSH